MRFARAAATALLLAAGSVSVTGLAASADTTPGPCADDQGVTLVVDPQGLGGDPSVTCITGLGEKATGWQVLESAGLAPEGTLRGGAGFLCRLGGVPAADQDIATASNPRYRETCAQTPPANAYWSYWSLVDGAWVYSQVGPSGHVVSPGSVEAWSFAIDASATDAPPPRVTPDDLAAQTSSTPSPDGAPTVSTPQAEPEIAADQVPAGTLVGLGVVVLLCAGGGVVWWQRKHR